MAREKICGVYCIKNNVDGKKYVGSSEDIYNRWAAHKRALNGNYHYNEHLQRAYNKHGANAFSFSILERCDKSIKFEREQYYIDNLCVCNENFGYNLAPIAGSGIIITDSLEWLKSGKAIMSLEQFKEVIHLFETTTISLSKIANITEVPIDSIYSLYNKKLYTSLVEKCVFLKRRSGRMIISDEMAKQIINKLMDGETVADISISLNVSASIVSDIKNKHSWKDLSRDLEFPYVKPNHPNKKRKINQHSSSGEYIKTWDSATDAIRELNIGTLSHAGIIKSCKHTEQLLCCGGYVWRYFDQINNYDNIKL